MSVNTDCRLFPRYRADTMREIIFSYIRIKIFFPTEPFVSSCKIYNTINCFCKSFRLMPYPIQPSALNKMDYVDHFLFQFPHFVCLFPLTQRLTVIFFGWQNASIRNWYQHKRQYRDQILYSHPNIYGLSSRKKVQNFYQDPLIAVK